MRLIDADALEDEVDTWGCNDYDKYDFIEAITNAPTIKDRSLEIAQKSIELGRKVGQLEGKLERPQGDLISREVLKKAFIDEWNYEADYAIFRQVENIIDNAPTVEPDMEFAKWVIEMIFGNNEVEDFDFELFSELACRKLEKLGLVKKTESEWKKKGGKEE